MPTVCCVCLGNICRSPMAAAVLRQLAQQLRPELPWAVDSAGTGDWHVGHPPDPRTRAVLRRHGIPYPDVARQISRDDLRRCDWVLVMDQQNLADVRRLAPEDARARIALLGSFDPAGPDEVPDPYHEDDAAFTAIYAQIDRACRAFLRQA
jgi:protein-tyrosine phosphatase